MAQFAISEEKLFKKGESMNALFDKGTVEALVNGTKGFNELAQTGATTLIDETIKMYIFFGVLGILKASVIFVVFGIASKYLNTFEKADDTKGATWVKSLRASSLIISLVFFTFYSLPHIKDIGKALVAPNLFVAEKGLELVKKNEAKVSNDSSTQTTKTQ